MLWFRFIIVYGVYLCDEVLSLCLYMPLACAHEEMVQVVLYDSGRGKVLLFFTRSVQ